MTTYSVYDYDRKVYDYYEGSGPKGTHAGPAPTAIGRHALGATIEQAAWTLPMGARKVGSGTMPKGRIAKPSGGVPLAGLVDLRSPTSVLMLGAAAYAAWRIFR